MHKAPRVVMRHCVADCDSWAPMKRAPSIEEQLSLFFGLASSFYWRSSLFERFSGAGRTRVRLFQEHRRGFFIVCFRAS
jgi:hypothetical protein